MIKPVCAYTCRHDGAYVCIYEQACSRVCVHTCAGKITPMWAYTNRHVSASVCIYAQA